MDKNVRELLEKFNIIKQKGYIPSVNNNKNGSGLTLEHHLGSTGGDICIPDFKNIEIKTLSIYSNSNLNMFSCTPDGKYCLATQWLSWKYGYPDKVYRKIRVLKALVNTQLNKVGLFFYFSLRVDKKNNIIVLDVYNHKKKLINSDIYWDFDSIEEKLIRKLSTLAIITNRKMEKNGKIYYKYIDIKIYKLKSFDEFIKLIEKDIIFVNFKTGVYKSGYYKGKFHDHGTGFEIRKENIEKLYDRIY